MLEDARERAREILAGMFDDELRELERIESDRERAIRRSEDLSRELQDAERAVEGVRAALDELPDQMSAAQLRADHLAVAEIQDRHARLQAQLEAAQARQRAASQALEREGTSPRRAAQEASGRAFAVAQRAEAVRDAILEQLEATLEPVRERSRRCSGVAETFQLYGR